MGGTFSLSPAAAGLQAAPGDYSRQMLRLAATTETIEILEIQDDGGGSGLK